MEQLTTRERFARVLRFQQVDRLPVMEWAPWWEKTLERWTGEGMPAQLSALPWPSDMIETHSYFGLDNHVQFWFRSLKASAQGGSVANAEDYEKIRADLFPENPLLLDVERFKSLAERQRRGELALWITLDGFFWHPRILFGIERHLYAFYDAPDLMHRMNSALLDFHLRSLDQFCSVCIPDFMTFAEDMSYNHGPMISRALFDEFIAPYYRRLVPKLREYGIVPIIDSDGDITRIVPWFAEVGVDGFLPLERQAGVDINELRKEHPRARFIGAYDKMVMNKSENEMREEFERLLPTMKSGGFIPSVDHQTPPGVSLSNYRIYVELLKEYCGKAAGWGTLKTMKLCLAILALTVATAQAAETLRVACSESLEQAIARARTAPKPVTIELRDGMYFLDRPIVLGLQDAGLTLAAYRNEKPVLSGGRRITGWRLGANQVWTAAVTGDFRELWVNGRRSTRARYPSKDYLRVAEVLDAPPAGKWMEGQTRFRFKEGDLKAWASMTDAEVVVMNRWVESRLPVVSVDENEKIITFGKRSVFALDKDDLYYVENIRDALAPGMWYLDRSAGSVGYRPLPGEDMQTAEVIAPMLPQVLRLEGAERVTLRGLTFAHTEWTLPEDTSGFPQAAVGVPGAVWGERARECTFEQCTFTHLGDYALELSRGCQGNRVAGCEMSDLGAGGVKIGEPAIRDNPAEQTFANTVTDCRIHDGGKLFHSAVGVWIGQSADNIITHNLIHDFYYSGVSIGWTWGYGRALATGNQVEWNHVHHVGVLADGDGPILSDMGGIYTLGNQRGAAIRNNLFHDIAGIRYGGWGIYFDEGTTDILAENNIVYRTTHGGFHQHYGKDNIVRNNIFAFGRDCQLQRTRVEPHLSFTFERNIVYWDKGNLLAGNWDGDQYTVSSNLLWRTDGKPLELPAGFQSGHSLIADPLFVAPANGDYSLQPESPAFRLGFKPLDISQIGPRKYR